MLNKIKLSENSKKIIYKIANDVMLTLLGFFIIALIAETILPGIASGRRGFEAIIFLIVLDLILIVYLSKNLEIEIKKSKKNKAIWALLFLGLLILVSNLLGFSPILILPIIILSVIVLYFLYQILGEEKI